MNRNYLPPALKSNGGQSPPHSSNQAPVQPPSVSSTPSASSSLRRYVHSGRVTKLSPVPEVGKFIPTNVF